MTKDFIDRSGVLFGRETDLRRLTDRSRRNGLTVVTGRPKMGKSWLLNEMARRLEEEGNFVIGFHEFKGGESSHFLYAVSDLYTRWLSNSDYRSQALVVWRNLRKDLVPRVGKVVGKIFSAISPESLAVEESVGNIVSEGFDELAKMQNDLLSGGLELPLLPYEQALSLIKLVQSVTKKRVVLVLDAWEKSHQINFEFDLVEAILSNDSEWGALHIVFGVRSPDFMFENSSNTIINKYITNLQMLSPSAERYDLEEMDLSSQREKNRLKKYLQKELSGVFKIPERQLIKLISGYPGVLSHWLNDAVRKDLFEYQDFRRVSEDAHNLRYPEVDRLLNGASKEQKTFLSRLIVMPQFTIKSWKIFEGEMKKGLPDISIGELIDLHLLIDEPFPHLGHDTRRNAILNWFASEEKGQFGEYCSQIIEIIAEKITDLKRLDMDCAGVLAQAAKIIGKVRLSVESEHLIYSACSTFGDHRGILTEKFDLSFKHIVNKNDKFCNLIGVALINRGWVKENVHKDVKGALDDNNSVVLLSSNLSPIIAAKAYLNSGKCLGKIGDAVGEIEKYNAVVRLENVSKDDVAEAYFLRAMCRDKRDESKSISEHGDLELAYKDYSEVVDLAGAPQDFVDKSLINRGWISRIFKNYEDAIADYRSVIINPDSLEENVNTALFCLGCCYGFMGRDFEAKREFSKFIDSPGISTIEKAKALFNRAKHKEKLSEYTYVSDLLEITELKSLPCEILDPVQRWLDKLKPKN